jgi:hypothetical protein
MVLESNGHSVEGRGEHAGFRLCEKIEMSKLFKYKESLLSRGNAMPWRSKDLNVDTLPTRPSPAREGVSFFYGYVSVRASARARARVCVCVYVCVCVCVCMCAQCVCI